MNRKAVAYNPRTVDPRIALMNLFRNSWDDIFLCDHCRSEMTAMAVRREEEALQAVEPTPPPPDRLVYFIGAEDGPIKVGSAAKPDVRLREIQTGHPYALSILATCAGGFDREGKYHNQFAASRLHGEWFERTPELLAEISRLSPTPAKELL